MVRRIALVVLAALALAAGSAAAGTGGYPNAAARCRATGRLAGACPRFQWGYEAGGRWSTISSRGFDYRNCTDYVAWKLGLTWWDFGFPGRGDASLWRRYAPRAGFVVTHTPHVHDVAWWPASADEPEGHVALVVRVGAGGTVTVAEYNEDGLGRYDWRVAQAPAYLHRR
ncbi:MAG TPA: CHAP domain-containing protein [Gaiellaceae bacterium]|nr:CHAP domain-containing protein [Gaiellaceae bacterium]